MNFEEQCYELLKKIPEGKVTTYKHLAKALGSNGARAVGNACRKNPNAPQVPCHRVVKSDGMLGGYAFGVDQKARLLRKEGIAVSDKLRVNLEEYLFEF
ncbi:MAG: MGMT family protein [Bdellovibrionales bacterium]|nr:MGMT family protein [Bdellovibrionales bacterium]